MQRFQNESNANEFARPGGWKREIRDFVPTLQRGKILIKIKIKINIV